MVDGRFKPKQVAGWTKSRNLSEGHARNVGLMPEQFTLVNVAEVDLNGRKSHGRNGIADRDTRMSIPSRVDHDRIEPLLGTLNPGNELSLQIRLLHRHLNAISLSELGDRSIDDFQRSTAINGLFPLPQQIQIGAMEHKDVVSRTPPI